mmetsp:Transcript_87050/g.168611  ORF Transcript_87050/g.168611 Transcript_87050/m.168611 type:complete len:286 (+) Transcript_87050:491-1348(+)
MRTKLLPPPPPPLLLPRTREACKRAQRAVRPSSTRPLLLAWRSPATGPCGRSWGSSSSERRSSNSSPQPEARGRRRLRSTAVALRAWSPLPTFWTCASSPPSCSPSPRKKREEERRRTAAGPGSKMPATAKVAAAAAVERRRRWQRPALSCVATWPCASLCCGAASTRSHTQPLRASQAKARRGTALRPRPPSGEGCAWCAGPCCTEFTRRTAATRLGNAARKKAAAMTSTAPRRWWTTMTAPPKRRAGRQRKRRRAVLAAAVAPPSRRRPRRSRTRTRPRLSSL